MHSRGALSVFHYGLLVGSLEDIGAIDKGAPRLEHCKCPLLNVERLILRGWDFLIITQDYKSAQKSFLNFVKSYYVRKHH